jgi:RNA polymerase sigma factor FliA
LKSNLRVVCGSGGTPSPPDPTTPAAVARRRRDEYVEANIHLVDAIARRLKAGRSWPPNIDIEDLRGAGYVGLLQAAERFTRAANIQFASFAQHRIKGEMLELVRRRQLKEASAEPLPERNDRARSGRYNRVVEINVADERSGLEIDRIETRERVQALLSRLTPREQEALRAYYLEANTLEAVGERLGVSTSQSGRIVRAAVHRARMLGKAA